MLPEKSPLRVNMLIRYFIRHSPGNEWEAASWNNLHLKPFASKTALTASSREKKTGTIAVGKRYSLAKNYIHEFLQKRSNMIRQRRNSCMISRLVSHVFKEECHSDDEVDFFSSTWAGRTSSLLQKQFSKHWEIQLNVWMFHLPRI